MRLLIDEALLAGHTAALPLAWLDGLTLVPFPPRGLTAEVPGAREADALLTRTMTRVPSSLLDALPNLRAVATLSSGTDHLDVAALAARGIALHTGHGGNAPPVADWVQWALDGLLGSLVGKRVLVVGVGAVGSAVAARLTTLGAELGLVDPPRAAREPEFQSRDLDAALAERWDAVTLHVPLERGGPWPTTHLLDAARLQRLAGAVVCNAARGGVLDEAAAAALRQQGVLAGLALDTFEGEPLPQPTVVAACDRATPHIAGHSIEGKLRVAWRAVAGLRAQAGLGEPGALDAAVAAVVAQQSGADLQPFARLSEADAALRACVATGQPFDAPRHSHRRTEWPA